MIFGGYFSPEYYFCDIFSRNNLTEHQLNGSSFFGVFLSRGIFTVRSSEGDMVWDQLLSRGPPYIYASIRNADRNLKLSTGQFLKVYISKYLATLAQKEYSAVAFQIAWPKIDNFLKLNRRVQAKFIIWMILK